jgi:hypothetical protein
MYHKQWAITCLGPNNKSYVRGSIQYVQDISYDDSGSSRGPGVTVWLRSSLGGEAWDYFGEVIPKTTESGIVKDTWIASSDGEDDCYDIVRVNDKRFVSMAAGGGPIDLVATPYGNQWRNSNPLIPGLNNSVLVSRSCPGQYALGASALCWGTGD